MYLFNNIEYDFDSLNFNYNRIRQDSEESVLRRLIHNLTDSENSSGCNSFRYTRNFLFWTQQCLEKLLKQSVLVDSNINLRYACLDSVLDNRYNDIAHLLRGKSYKEKFNIYMDLFSCGIFNKKLLSDFIKILRKKYIDLDKVSSNDFKKFFRVDSSLQVSDYLDYLRLTADELDRLKLILRNTVGYNKYRAMMYHHGTQYILKYDSRLLNEFGDDKFIDYIYNLYVPSRYSYTFSDSLIYDNSILYAWIFKVYAKFNSIYSSSDYISSCKRVSDDINVEIDLFIKSYNEIESEVAVTDDLNSSSNIDCINQSTYTVTDNMSIF